MGGCGGQNTHSLPQKKKKDVHVLTFGTIDTLLHGKGGIAGRFNIVNHQFTLK